jgi:hypothetical protein
MKNVKNWKKKTIQRVATNTIGYTREQANKEWFDEECAEEKNTARERAIPNNTSGAKNAQKQKKGKAVQRRSFNRD